MTYKIPVRGGLPYRLDPTPDSLLNCVDFTVPGQAAPKGSKSPKGRTKTGRIVMVESSKEVGPWMAIVKLAAQRAMGDAELIPGPVAVDLTFTLRRPIGTPKTRPTPPAIKQPDLDKLERAVLDALQGVCYAVDSQVTSIRSHKRIAELGEPPATRIAVWGLV